VQFVHVIKKSALT